MNLLIARSAYQAACPPPPPIRVEPLSRPAAQAGGRGRPTTWRRIYDEGVAVGLAPPLGRKSVDRSSPAAWAGGGVPARTLPTYQAATGSSLGPSRGGDQVSHPRRAVDLMAID
jgi:hypothetical protein